MIDDDYEISEYPGYKLTRLVLTSAPMVVGSALAATYALDRRFSSGLVVASLFTSACALVQVFVYRSEISSEFDLFFKEASAFSTISIACILNFGVFACLQRLGQRRKSRDRMFYCGCIAACQFVIFLMAQRTSLLLGFCGITLFIYRRAPGRIASGLAASMAVLVTAMLAQHLVAFGESTGVGSLQYQTQRLGSLIGGNDHSARSRVLAIQFCVENAWHNALGHGFGAFARDYRILHYPHNLLAEAAYELGWGGLALVLLLCWQAGYALLTLGARATDDFLTMSLLATSLYVMKAGDMSCIGVWIPWIYVGMSYTCQNSEAFSKPERFPH